MATAGEVLTLDIEKPAAGGRMIARASGQVVLVAGVIPGERARVRIERVGKGVAYGVAVEIEQPSPARRPPICDPLCGGSLYAHIAYDEQRAIKSAVIGDALRRIARLTWDRQVPVAASPETGYRMRARLHIRNGRLGFFRDGSHQLCDAAVTAQLLPQTVDAVAAVAAATGALSLEAAEVEVSENIAASERAVHIDVSRGRLAPDSATPLAAGVTGVSRGNSERGSRIDVIAGNPYVTDTLTINGQLMRLRRHVTAFFQGNRYLLASLVTHVVDQIGGDGAVVDLYAGVGLFSIAIAQSGRRVEAVEGDRMAAADLRDNAEQSGGAVAVVHAPVESFRHASGAVSTLLVDPPRTGMSREALNVAMGLNASRVVYVSCDVATLARDMRVLVDAGYTVQRIDGFDLFPNTPHVETVAVFER